MKESVLIFIIALISFFGKSQSYLPCVNTDFEQGNYNGWRVDTATACDTGPSCYTNGSMGTGTSAPIFPDVIPYPRHSITVGGNFDSEIGPALVTSSPFSGNSSLRLGNKGINGEVDIIEKEFLVQAQSPLFTYEFALVLQDPGHAVDSQPFFQVQFYDTNDILINSCANYYVASSANNPGFFTTGIGNQKRVWKDWSKVTADFTPWINQRLKARFIVSDCSEGGHYGYAYLDANCNVPEISLRTTCDKVFLTVPEGYYKYQWNTGDPADTNSALEVNTPGYYQVVITSESGCILTIDSTFVSIPEVLNSSAILTQPKCFGDVNTGQILVKARGGNPFYEYSIDNGSVYQNDSLFQNLDTGIYIINVRDIFNCIFKDTVKIEYPPLLSANLSFSDPRCYNDSSGYISYTTNGGIAPYSISIDSGNSFSMVDTVKGIFGGKYNIVIRDSNNCEILDSVTITEPPPFLIDITPDTTICPNTNIAIGATLTGGSPPYTYHWGNTNTLSANVISPSQDTTVTVYATDRNSCRTNDTSTTVRIFPPLSIRDTNYKICVDSFVYISTQAFGGDSNYQYQWDLLGSNQAYTVTPVNTTVYRYTVLDGCNQSVRDSITVEVEQLVPIMFDVDQNFGCPPLEINITNNTDPIWFTNCTWDMGDSNSAIGKNSTIINGCSDFSFTYQDTGCFNIKLSFTTPFGCYNELIQNNIVCLDPPPIASFELNPENPSVFLNNVSTNNLSQNANSYIWDLPDGTVSTFFNPSFVLDNNNSQDYTICLTALNDVGCRDTFCREITIENEATIYVPNVFTPNGDKDNDIFRPILRGYDYETYEIKIYNRWGKIIYESRDYNQGWDGTYHGSIMPQGSYIWTLKAKIRDKSMPSFYEGHLILLK